MNLKFRYLFFGLLLLGSMAFAACTSDTDCKRGEQCVFVNDPGPPPIKGFACMFKGVACTTDANCNPDEKCDTNTKLCAPNVQGMPKGAFVCEAGGIGAIGDLALPLAAGASVLTALLIGLGYLLGQWTQNPKVTLWARTESVQLAVSIIVVLLMLSALRAFCGFNFGSIVSLFGYSVGNADQGISVFEAARMYLVESGTYIKDILEVARYHLSAYTVLQLRSIWVASENAAANVLLNLFGSSIGLGVASGISASPETGYSFASAAIGLAFNSLLFSYLSTLNYYFILEYIYSGLVFFLLPLAIFLRSMPYLRTLGSLLMSVALAYVFVYPATLALFYIDLHNPQSALMPPFSADFAKYIGRESSLRDIGGAGDIAAAVFTLGISDVASGGMHGNLFPHGSREMEILRLSGHAFLLGVFIPTLALLMAAASVAYMNRFLGEEIDLSRMVQMV